MQAELLPMLRTCDRDGCDNSFTPKGDGNTPYLSSEMGGRYFCSQTCKSLYQSAPPTMREALEVELRRLNAYNPALLAHQLHSSLTPSVIEIPTADPKVRRFKITTHPLTSLLSCLISGDDNYLQHTGEHGITQTLMRIGDFSCVISRVAPGARLREIARVKLRAPVPLGATVVVSATKTKSGRGFTRYLVESQLEDGTPVSEPTTVVTYLPA